MARKEINSTDWLEDRKAKTAMGTVLIGSLKCGVFSDVQFQYSGNTKHRNVPFRILWSSADDTSVQHPLDNPSNIQGTV